MRNPTPRAPLRVLTSAEAAAGDASAIAAGIPSRALMQRAASAAASEIALRYRDRVGRGVLVFAGPGNNGGDAWVVARALHDAGMTVRCVEPVPAKTADSIAERGLAIEAIGNEALVTLDAALAGGESIVVDGLLGTGATAEPRGAIAECVGVVTALADRGTTVVALDAPTGLDATTGIAAPNSVRADLTLTFGSAKRGLLVNREACGTIVVLDIGLGAYIQTAGAAPALIDERWVSEQLPAIAWNAHKGTRKKLAVVGGARGMAGASMLVARAAMRSGVGMVKLIVADQSVPVVQEAEPHALCAAWPVDDAACERDLRAWADAIVIGPGLGLDDESAALIERVLRVWRGPTLIDADALTLLASRMGELGPLLAGRSTLLTPHATEFGRLAEMDVEHVLEHRFQVGADLAGRLGVTVLLKGVPTIVSSPSGERLVSATGTPALATGGSGDVLSGIAGTLLAQMGDPLRAGAAAAWVHGRAAERATLADHGVVRGVALEDVVRQLQGSWIFDARPARYPVLAEIPLPRAHS